MCYGLRFCLPVESIHCHFLSILIDLYSSRFCYHLLKVLIFNSLEGFKIQYFIQQQSLQVILCMVKGIVFAFRASRSQSGKKENNSVPENTKNTPVIEVTPLNSMPYICPSMPGNNKGNENAENKGGPSMIFLPSEPNAEFRNLIDQAKTGAVALTGSAAMGKIGPTVGLIDIAESDDSYYFRVALPGVSRDESKS